MLKPCVEEFLGECTAFPAGAHDDQVDAWSQDAKYLLHHRGMRKKLRVIWQERDLGLDSCLGRAGEVRGITRSNCRDRWSSGNGTGAHNFASAPALDGRLATLVELELAHIRHALEACHG